MYTQNCTQFGLKWYKMCAGGRLVDLQYSSWSATQPVYTHSCVVFTLSGDWNVSDCYQQQQFICQSQCSALLTYLLTMSEWLRVCLYI